MCQLVRPSWWDDVPREAKQAEMNGCGPGGWKFDLIPDTVWGLGISEACDVHDVEYAFGNSRASADARLFANICLLCAEKGSRWLLPFRLVRAVTMYQAVRAFGWKFYRGSA